MTAQRLRPVATYSDNVAANVEFLGGRARDLGADELDRSKTLDTKATAMVAGCVAVIGAGAAFAARLAEVSGGAPAKTAWAIELTTALVLVFVAAGFAVWALVPKAVRIAVAQSEVDAWVTEAVLEQDPTFNQGVQLHAATASVAHARRVNRRKANRLRVASWVFAAALAAIVGLAVHLSFHAAQAASDDGRSHPNSKRAS